MTNPIFALLTLLLPFTTLSDALTTGSSPTTSSSEGLDSRNGAGFYACTGTHWSGACIWQAATDACVNTDGSPKPFSLGPDHGVVCTLYRGPNCGSEGEAVDNFRWPGSGDVGKGTAGGFGSIGSWTCKLG